jgi:SM-20-related protein
LLDIFNGLIDSYVADKVGITQGFLSVPLSVLLKENLLALYANQQLLEAGIGNENKLTHDKLLRSDKIYWLDKSHNDVHENAFFELMDSFVLHLNQTCYTGITGYEFHYAMYETGSFYKKHLDQFKSNKSRAFSMIMYLNTNWKEADGGELCIYHSDFTQTISPQQGKCVFFKSSELEHEVLLTNQPRFSITGWLRTD